jgi:hypothetical protein
VAERAAELPPVGNKSSVVVTASVFVSIVVLLLRGFPETLASHFSVK